MGRAEARLGSSARQLAAASVSAMTVKARAVKTRKVTQINFGLNHKVSDKTREEVSASLHLARTGCGHQHTIPYHTIPHS